MPEEIEMIANELSDIINSPNLSKTLFVSIIEKFVSNFKHIETGKNLDQKM